jgi:hypothetical protein
MKNQIERLRALAKEALEQFRAEIDAGGEPPYPAWVDDVLDVCNFAERAIGIVSAPPSIAA